MKKYAFALDLKDDSEKIEEYIQHHQNVWPEVLQSIKESGVKNMEIFHVGNRLFMLVSVSNNFSIEKDTIGNPENPIEQKWEELMWNYQQKLPFAKSGEKWVLMDKIFEL
ncbi:MAG: L-rhamnose mutarotase [Galbibacter orientalis]|uniref:L-rhamnose mutarotase n=1 Tax=Galbibacter orientalis TaxID=453852 RepID=UPI003001BEC3